MYRPAYSFVIQLTPGRVLVSPGGAFDVTRPRLPAEQEVPDGPTENHLVVLAGSYQIPPVRKVSS